MSSNILRGVILRGVTVPPLFQHISGLAIILILINISGCAAVGPDYIPVKSGVESAWHSDLKGGVIDKRPLPSDLSQWWKNFNDPVLSSLIDRAVKSNLSLKEAMARIRESRARIGISRSSLLPSVGSSASVSRSRSSKNSGGGGENNHYFSGFDASWELDIFGGKQRSVEASDAKFRSGVEDLHNVLVSLLAEVAINYIDARSYQSRLAIAAANLNIQQETYQLVESQWLAGLDSELSLQQARYSLEKSRSQIPTLRTGLEEAMNHIAVLLGQSPGSVHAELQVEQPVPHPPLEVAVGVPADTIRQRPDIRMAEQEIVYQTALVGVATSDLYPRFTLSGTIGLESLSGSDLLTIGSRSWSMGPGFSWNVFDAGSIRKNIEAQSALQEQSLIQYRAAVLSALEEVENALIAYSEEQQRRHSLIAAAEAARKAVALSKAQYSSGLVDFKDVMETEQSLLTLEDELAQSNGTVSSNLVRLYKALGGGWSSIIHPVEEKNRGNGEYSK